MSGIYVRQGETYVSMAETPFDAERVLQALIAQHPEVLADESSGQEPTDGSLRYRHHRARLRPALA
jgi:hypothetical protein